MFDSKSVFDQRQSVWLLTQTVGRFSSGARLRDALQVDHEIAYRPGSADDIPGLQDVEVRAGQRFRDVGMAEIADDDPPDQRLLRRLIASEQLWVATHHDNLVGYAIAAPIDDHAHIDQISVLPEYSGRRIGSRLLQIGCDWAANRGAWRATLFTYESVPWNAPYYRTLGFSDIEPATFGPGLERIWQEERQTDLHNWQRVTLARLTPTNSAGASERFHL